jgi:hypothetical protein
MPELCVAMWIQRGSVKCLAVADAPGTPNCTTRMLFLHDPSHLPMDQC